MLHLHPRHLDCCTHTQTHRAINFLSLWHSSNVLIHHNHAHSTAHVTSHQHSECKHFHLGESHKHTMNAAIWLRIKSAKVSQTWTDMMPPSLSVLLREELLQRGGLHTVDALATLREEHIRNNTNSKQCCVGKQLY